MPLFKVQKLQKPHFMTQLFSLSKIFRKSLCGSNWHSNRFAQKSLIQHLIIFFQNQKIKNSRSMSILGHIGATNLGRSHWGLWVICFQLIEHSVPENEMYNRSLNNFLSIFSTSWKNYPISWKTIFFGILRYQTCTFSSENCVKTNRSVQVINNDFEMSKEFHYILGQKENFWSVLKLFVRFPRTFSIY